MLNNFASPPILTRCALQEKSNLIALQKKLEELFQAGLSANGYDGNGLEASDTEEVNKSVDTILVVSSFSTQSAGNRPKAVLRPEGVRIRVFHVTVFLIEVWLQRFSPCFLVARTRPLALIQSDSRQQVVIRKSEII